MQKLTIAGNVALSELIWCEFDSGVIFWRERTLEILSRMGLGLGTKKLGTWNSRYAGKPGFTACDGSGYLMGRIARKAYKAHRVIWALKYGHWPKDQIDHVNGIRADNRLINLRDVSQSENNRNLKSRSDNKSGHVGVCFDNDRLKWIATINSRYIGRFASKEDAIFARLNHPQASSFTERHGL